MHGFEMQMAVVSISWAPWVSRSKLVTWVDVQCQYDLLLCFFFCFYVAGSLSHHFVCTWSHACDAISKAIDIAYLSLTMVHFLLISIKLNNLGYRCVVLPQDKSDPVNRYISCPNDWKFVLLDQHPQKK